ncbi:asparagine-rich antigen [Plasmodium gonderi]|uniref:Asparagine-rich antigen n=1 Tax=Plasmodium gonderi TaxID=77519 RepID=A0A1Y1JBW6_PLAGO|nr:asparagine-rich antigen [Plasmodium gonderi]GAW80021.1 asparagine-rich antigen [Plasmodium gonderi]
MKKKNIAATTSYGKMKNRVNRYDMNGSYNFIESKNSGKVQGNAITGDTKKNRSDANTSGKGPNSSQISNIQNGGITGGNNHHSQVMKYGKNAYQYDYNSYGSKKVGEYREKIKSTAKNAGSVGENTTHNEGRNNQICGNNSVTPDNKAIQETAGNKIKEGNTNLNGTNMSRKSMSGTNVSGTNVSGTNMNGTNGIRKQNEGRKGGNKDESGNEEVSILREKICFKMLKSIDIYITEIIMKSSFVTVYKMKEDEVKWIRADIEGFLYIVRRSIKPTYRLIITNKKNENHLVQDIHGRIKLSTDQNYIFYRVYNEENNSKSTYSLWFYSTEEKEKIYNMLRELVDMATSTTPASGAGNLGNPDHNSIENNGNVSYVHSKSINYILSKNENGVNESVVTAAEGKILVDKSNEAPLKNAPNGCGQELPKSVPNHAGVNLPGGTLNMGSNDGSLISAHITNHSSSRTINHSSSSTINHNSNHNSVHEARKTNAKKTNPYTMYDNVRDNDNGKSFELKGTNKQDFIYAKMNYPVIGASGNILNGGTQSSYENYLKNFYNVNENGEANGITSIGHRTKMNGHLIEGHNTCDFNVKGDIQQNNVDFKDKVGRKLLNLIKGLPMEENEKENENGTENEVEKGSERVIGQGVGMEVEMGPEKGNANLKKLEDYDFYENRKGEDSSRGINNNLIKETKGNLYSNKKNSGISGGEAIMNLLGLSKNSDFKKDEGEDKKKKKKKKNGNANGNSNITNVIMNENLNGESTGNVQVAGGSVTPVVLNNTHATNVYDTNNDITKTNMQKRGMQLREAQLREMHMRVMPMNGMPMNRMSMNEMQMNEMQMNEIPMNELPMNEVQMNEIQLNEIQLNEIPSNGILMNGIPLNRMHANGIQTKGIQKNGIQTRGIQTSGIETNDMDMLSPLGEEIINGGNGKTVRYNKSKFDCSDEVLSSNHILDQSYLEKQGYQNNSVESVHNKRIMNTGQMDEEKNMTNVFLDIIKLKSDKTNNVHPVTGRNHHLGHDVVNEYNTDSYDLLFKMQNGNGSGERRTKVGNQIDRFVANNHLGIHSNNDPFDHGEISGKNNNTGYMPNEKQLLKCEDNVLDNYNSLEGYKNRNILLNRNIIHNVIKETLQSDEFVNLLWKKLLNSKNIM